MIRTPQTLIFKVLRLVEVWWREETPGSRGHLADQADRALEKASAWLVEQQDDDGAFRCREDEDFSDGYLITGYALRALREHPQPASVADRIALGFEFLETMVQEDGSVDLGGCLYPTAAAASALLLFAETRRKRYTKLVSALARYLVEAQFAEPLGYQPANREFGGFAYQPARCDDNREKPPSELDAPHLSGTLLAVEALARSHHPDARDALGKARKFVESCQNFGKSSDDTDSDSNDGGFIFSPVIADLNKAGACNTITGFRSYGTMSANGVRLLHYLGYDRSDPRFVAAVRWLERHFDPKRVPGDYAPERESQRPATYFYYAWTVAHALELLGNPVLETERGPVTWARALAEELVRRQLPNGVWRNPVASRKENVLPIGNLVSLPALAVCRRHLSR